MDADGKTRHVGYQHQPAVGMRLVGIVFPLQYEPEHHRGECRRIGINFAFDSREPESVAESVYQCAHHGCPFDGYELAHRDVFAVAHDELTGEMGDCPEQKHDASCRQQCAHSVHHACHLGRIACKMREKIGCKGKERCPGRVPYFKLIACCYELGTVPETCRWFYCGTVNKGGYQESEPPQRVVH